MGNIGDNISTDVPTVGALGTGYAADLRTILLEVVARLEARVPLGSLAAGSAGESIDLNNTPVKNAEYLGLYAGSSAPSGTPYGRWARYNGNVYWVDASGAVQITAGANLNAAGIGGIVGDYGGSDPARVSFVGASERYDFWDDQAGGGYAMTRARTYEAVDEATGRTVSIRPDTSIAASYNFLLPDNDPAAGVSVLTINSSGKLQLGESAAITNLPSFTGGPKHDDHTEWYSAASLARYVVVGNAALNEDDATDEHGEIDAGAAISTLDYFLPSPPVGRRVKSVSVRHVKTGSGTETLTVTLYSIADGVSTSLASATSTAEGAYTTVTATATSTVAAATRYKVRVAYTTTGAYTMSKTAAIGITYDYV